MTKLEYLLEIKNKTGKQISYNKAPDKIFRGCYNIIIVFLFT